jgi:hypothetical protein
MPNLICDPALRVPSFAGTAVLAAVPKGSALLITRWPSGPSALWWNDDCALGQRIGDVLANPRTIAARSTASEHQVAVAHRVIHRFRG